MLKEKVLQLAKKYAPETIEIRRHIHAHPELSYKEFQTSALVQEKLKDLDIPFEIKATTGVVGIIRGKNPDTRVIALRADMDALPIKEENLVLVFWIAFVLSWGSFQTEFAKMFLSSLLQVKGVLRKTSLVRERGHLKSLWTRWMW